jgi:hypothetical protein
MGWSALHVVLVLTYRRQRPVVLTHVGPLPSGLLFPQLPPSALLRVLRVSAVDSPRYDVPSSAEGP